MHEPRHLRTRTGAWPGRDSFVRVVLVGMYDTNTVSLAPQVLRAVAEPVAAEHGHVVEVLEFSIFSDSVDTMAARIAALRPDAVGFSCYVWNHRQVLALAGMLECTIVVGGPHVTGIERELLASNPGIDIVVTGEGETVFVQLLEHWAGLRPLDAVPGITTRELRTEPARPTDLASIPPLQARIARESPHITWLSFETSRGCPMRCGYCTWSQSRRMRYYPLEHVLAELDVILTNPRISEVYFCDSSLLFDKRRAIAILDHIIASGSSTPFRYEFSAEQLDDEVIERMARLPTNEFNFGIQTVNPAALEVMGRRFDRALFESRYHAFVRALPDARVTVDLIYGLPGDDLTGYVTSIDYAMSLPSVSRILTNPLLVLPGSRFFRDRDALGLTLAADGSYMVESNGTFSASDMAAARRFSFYLGLLYLNTALRDALLDLAQRSGRSPAETMIGFFESLPSPLVDDDYPATIPSTTEGFERRNRAMGTALGRFPEIVSAFVESTGDRYAGLRESYADAFGPQYHKYVRFAEPGNPR